MFRLTHAAKKKNGLLRARHWILTVVTIGSLISSDQANAASELVDRDLKLSSYGRLGASFALEPHSRRYDPESCLVLRRSDETLLQTSFLHLFRNHTRQCLAPILKTLDTNIMALSYNRCEYNRLFRQAFGPNVGVIFSIGARGAFRKNIDPEYQSITENILEQVKLDLQSVSNCLHEFNGISTWYNSYGIDKYENYREHFINHTMR